MNDGRFPLRDSGRNSGGKTSWFTVNQRPIGTPVYSELRRARAWTPCLVPSATGRREAHTPARLDRGLVHREPRPDRTSWSGAKRCGLGPVVHGEPRAGNTAPGGRRFTVNHDAEPTPFRPGSRGPIGPWFTVNQTPIEASGGRQPPVFSVAGQTGHGAYAPAPSVHHKPASLSGVGSP